MSSSNIPGAGLKKSNPAIVVFFKLARGGMGSSPFFQVVMTKFWKNGKWKSG